MKTKYTCRLHMGLVFFICCRSHFLPSGGLLKSQMLLPGWVVSESGSGLEMQWGGDTCWRIFRRAFGLLEWSLVIFLKCEGDPPLLPWIPARWDRQPGSWGLDASCSRRAAAGRMVGQTMLADQWTARELLGGGSLESSFWSSWRRAWFLMSVGRQIRKTRERQNVWEKRKEERSRERVFWGKEILIWRSSKRGQKKGARSQVSFYLRGNFSGMDLVHYLLYFVFGYR